MYSVNGLSNDNNRDIIKEFINHTRIHEHDFISKERISSFICITCGSHYCKKCGKLVTISDKGYMQYNMYN